jgi:hypothetical protein
MSRTVTDVGHGVDLGKNFIRGAARMLVADLTEPFPTVLDDVIRMDTTSGDEVQTLTVTGTPTGGDFTLTFRGYTTAAIAYDATAADVQAALEALSTVGTGGVVASGGALPGSALTLTFAAQLGDQAVPLITATGNLTGGTTPTASVARTTAGFGQYDAQTGWTDLGATKGGITVLRNNAEEAFDVDQIYADILTLPTTWEMNVQASCARADIDLLQYLWEGGTITVNSAPTTGPERTLPLGTPTAYRQRRLAVYFQRPSIDGGVTAGKIRAYCFRITQRTAQESTLVHNKTGDQATVPFTWRAIPDQNVVDANARFGSIIDQAAA